MFGLQRHVGNMFSTNQITYQPKTMIEDEFTIKKGLVAEIEKRRAALLFI